MDDLISRQAAIDRINKQREHLQPDIYPQDKIGDAAYRICAEFIERLPSAERRKRGRWIPVDSYSACGGDEATWVAHGNPTAFWYCSFCREQNYVGEDGAPLLTDFCPQCGADMR